ncbi:MAG: cytochrome ubiquinol oxidase subunit I [Marinilabiliales bacterium]|nr:MAG: cytochrome ubiquinol oxidase subunit I [Marinilabiliales bacterium]
MEQFSVELVDWSRAQFALTAIYHWFFVPLTLGLSFIVAFMHSIYYKTGDEKWKNMTKFWMKLFGINFAIGVATGIILEFEFGTNWSNYSWIVGDIFGAPLAIEGIVAFFLESTFIAVMFFGWGRVSKKFHMMSSWLVAFGSNLSALWILVANAWMQNPVGTKFNMDTARNEMISFFDVALSSTAIFKFTHTISQAYVIGSLFVIAVSAWYLLKKRHLLFAKQSILIASVFGLVSAVCVAFTGDSSAYDVAQKQPMKLAAMEGLYDGEQNADLYAFGFLNNRKDNSNFKGIRIPSMLSIMAYRDPNAFVAGVNDILNGNEAQGILPTETRMEKGRIAIQALADYTLAKKAGDKELAQQKYIEFEENYAHFGYGFFQDKEEVVPHVKLTFYSFHIMVGFGLFFIALFAWLLYASMKNKLEKHKWVLRLSVWSLLFGYIASELGWLVAEIGRQPWTIQDILPVGAATSHLSVGNVQTTFFLFLALFTVLLIAEIKIMVFQIRKGPEKGGSHV